MGDFAAAVRLLGAHAGEPARQGLNPQFTPIVPNGFVPAVVAVDGSHAVLRDSGAVWVIAVTAEAMPWLAPTDRPAPFPQPEIYAATADAAQALLDERYAGAGFEAPTARTAEAFAEAMRALLETEAALAAAAQLPPHGLLLLDGALHGLPIGPAAQAARILDAVGARHVAAVAKRSRLEAGGHPLVPALLEVGRRTLPDSAWSTPTPGVAGSFVCRLHRAAPHAFRIDVSDSTALPLVAYLSRDAAYCGYPYPLAKVHNRVALTAARTAELKARLDSALRRAGRHVAELASDPHDILDRSVPN